MSNQQGIQSAIQYFQSGNIRQAKQILGNYISGHPDDINANLLSAAISATESNFAEVVKKCSKILAIDPANVRASYNAAVACEKLKKHRDTKKFASQVLQYDATNVHAKLLLVGALYDLGEVDESRQQCMQVILEYKSNVDVIASICTLFFTRNATSIIEEMLEHVLEKDAENMAVLFNLVTLSINEKNFVKAEKFSNKLISIDANNFNAMNARVSILFAQGKIKECIRLVESLPQSLVSDNRVILRKLAECYMGEAENDKAILTFKKCIATNINVAECFHNIGIIEDRQDNIDGAIQAYRSSLAVAPDSLNTYYNLAFVFDKKGDRSQAIKAIKKCFEIQDSPKVRQAFVAIVSSTVVGDIDSSIESIIMDIVSDDVTNAQSLSRLVASLLKHKFPVINRLFHLANEDNYNDFIGQLKQDVTELKDISMLQLYFVNLPITEYGFECFAKMLRRALLLLCHAGEMDSCDVNDLCSSLAIRCYIDGYVFTATEEEKRVINELVDHKLNDTSFPDELDVALLAMYISLYKLYRENGLNINAADYNGLYRKLLRLQLDDNISEENLYNSIEHPYEINNEISLTVKRQYEGNPYPVWQILSAREAEDISDILESVVSYSNSIKPTFDSPDILIAGCGTGSHAIQTAMRIRHQSMTAIDLSRRSLAFAKRKSIDYGYEYIDFKEMDILNVSMLNKKFDIIESVGVLHHMQEPLAGLKCLVDVLKPGGLMNIGLYSKIARRYILKAKEIYDAPDKYVSDDDIREARVTLMNSDDKDLVRNVSLQKDFYSLHDCRDLIFHENENNYDVDELSDLLAEAGLEFIGFDSNDAVALSRFRKMFPEKNSQSSLKKWGIFEEKYPDTFASMYVFWCRRKATGI